MAWTSPRTWVAGEVLTADLLNTHLRDNLNAAFPVGSLHWFMQSETSVETTINGFCLEANGAAVSRTTYSSLNSVCSGLSYPFGSGNGSTTFNLPDLRGRAAWMCGSNAACDIGDSDGVAESSRQPKHTHTSSQNFSIGNESSHTHGPSGGGNFVKTQASPTVAAGSDFGYTTVSATGAGTSHTHTLSGGITAIGSGMSGSDAVSHLFVGVMGVKY